MTQTTTDKELLRHVEIEALTGRKWQLKTWEHDCTCGRYDRTYLGYELITPEGEVLFTGDDFGCSPLHAIDSDNALRALLGFLTLRPGDTDREYFDSYTPAQMDFATSFECEAMQLYSDDCGYDELAPEPFVNLDDWVNEEEED